ncbi:hypothetical protein ACKKBF_B36980 [Auxenochlorella protothecoides x Auxenochlorella symbiontica]
MTVPDTTGPGEPACSRVVIHVECALRADSCATLEETRHHLMQFLGSLSKVTYVEGPLTVDPQMAPFLAEHAARVCIVDLEDRPDLAGRPMLSWDVEWEVACFALDRQGAASDDEGEEGCPSHREWILPNEEFEGQWETLYYETCIKQRLLRYATSALRFSMQGVDPGLISWNRVVLLHGPPGTGKTSLCKALAQKLSIRLMPQFSQGILIEVNAHSLFSKWFSESGKLIGRLFAKIQEVVEDASSLVFVLIDEVESLTAARKSAVGGSEPTDAIRAVNAILTQLDALKRHPNVMVLTTSNITEAIDVAFVDRADIKAYIGPPNLEARYAILASCLSELDRAGIVRDMGSIPGFSHALRLGTVMDEGGAEGLADHVARSLLDTARLAEGLSGRSLRKLPFLAHASQAWDQRGPCPAAAFMRALQQALDSEGVDRARMLAS